MTAQQRLRLRPGVFLWLLLFAFNFASQANLAYNRQSTFAAEGTGLVEQGRNALGQLTSKVGGPAAPGSTAVSDIFLNATKNGLDFVDREESIKTPFGLRRYDVVLADSGGVNWRYLMLKIERDMIELDPGPLNKEPWAGKGLR
jgi:hypothetical protein